MNPAHRSDLPDRPINPGLIWIRRLFRWSRRIMIKARLGRRGKLSPDCVIGKNATLLPPERFEVGQRVYIGQDFFLQTNLVIGSDVLISSRVAFISNDHAFDDPKETITSQGRLPATTCYLEGDNLIGFGATIVGAVKVGRGAIVAAGAMVTKDVEPACIVAGVPARVIRSRFLVSSTDTASTRDRSSIDAS